MEIEIHRPELFMEIKINRTEILMKKSFLFSVDL